MPALKDIPDRPIAIDLRIDQSLAVQLRAPAAAWSLWPEAPFGASADSSVWPSAFVHQHETTADRIPIAAGEAAYWQAMGCWDDVGELTQHVIPLPIETEVIALGMAPTDTQRAPEDTLLGQLIETGVSEETRQLQADLLGYDITDVYLNSAVFDSAAPEDQTISHVARSASGLIETRESADKLLTVLEQADPAHAPLFVISIWSLGLRQST